MPNAEALRLQAHLNCELVDSARGENYHRTRFELDAVDDVLRYGSFVQQQSVHEWNEYCEEMFLARYVPLRYTEWRSSNFAGH
jgi:hypothetical protein